MKATKNIHSINIKLTKYGYCFNEKIILKKTICLKIFKQKSFESINDSMNIYSFIFSPKFLVRFLLAFVYLLLTFLILFFCTYFLFHLRKHIVVIMNWNNNEILNFWFSLYNSSGSRGNIKLGKKRWMRLINLSV